MATAMATFLRFRVGAARERYGLLEKGKVIALQGEPFTSWERTQESFSLGEVRLLSPCMPSKVVCVATNYRAVLEAKGQAAPAEPVIFLKPSSAVIGPGESICCPRGLERLGYEAELAVVIRHKIKNVSREEALGHVLGYTVANDITAKDFMTGGPWTKGKCFDTFLPLGPYIATGLDPNNLAIRAWVNGQVTQDACTADMVFKVADIIAYVSQIMTMYPGDVICTGTPPGAGFIKPGDIVEVGVEGIGVLRNAVVQA